MALKLKFKEIKNKQILAVEFDNFKKSNAISMEMLDSIINKLSNHTYINKFKCIVIKGSNKGPFSSGADLNDIYKLIKENNINLYHSKMNALINIILNLDIPVICLIRSFCFGAGLIIALHSDILLASENSLFCIPASKLNIKVPKNHILYLKNKFKDNFIKDIILSSRQFSAKEAYENNLINACVKEKNFETYTNKYLHKIVSSEKNIISFYMKLLKKN